MTKIDNYTLVRPLNFGEVRKIRKTLSEFAEASNKLQGKKKLTPKELKDMANLITTTDDTDQIVVDTLEACLGMTQKQLDKLTYPEASALFGKVYLESTTIKKNLNEPYG